MNNIELREHSIVLAHKLNPSTNLNQLLGDANQLYHYLQQETALVEDGNLLAFIRQLKIRSPTQGLIPFQPFPHQIRLLEYLDSQADLIINSARQMGVTVVLAGYASFIAASRPNQTLVWAADNYTKSLAALDIISGFAETPSGIMRERGIVTYENGSQIIARGVSADALRGLHVTHIIVDNAAYVSHAKFNAMWDASIEREDFRARKILASTPNEPKGIFYDTWVQKGQWRKLMLPWYEHTNRADMDVLSTDQFQRDFCCEFTSNLQPT